MIQPATPANETERLAALRSLELLDSAPEASFDRITDMAARHFSVPVCVISLVDAEREWFKSACGLDERQNPRRLAFCSHTILSNEVLVIEDALTDERFHDNPLVTRAHGIRFYAGAPLTDRNGANIGAFCVKDYWPRVFGPDERWMLAQFAAVVMDLIELRRLARTQACTQARTAQLH